MTIPTTGSFTSETIRSEWNLPLPFTSEQVRAAASLSEPWTSDQLRGKTAMTLSITGYFNEQAAGGSGSLARYRSVGVFNISKSGGGPITAYGWGFTSNAFINQSDQTTSAYTLQGPIYQRQSFTFDEPVTVFCDVTVDGQVHRVIRGGLAVTTDQLA